MFAESFFALFDSEEQIYWQTFGFFLAIELHAIGCCIPAWVNSKETAIPHGSEEMEDISVDLPEFGCCVVCTNCDAFEQSS